MEEGEIEVDSIEPRIISPPLNVNAESAASEHS